MAFVKVDLAKKYRTDSVKKTSVAKTIEQIYESIANTTMLSIDGKKWDAKKGTAVEAERKRNTLVWHEATKSWLVFINYGSELAYAYDVKADKSNREGAKKLAFDYLESLKVGKIGNDEKAAIASVVNKAKERGKKLAQSNRRK